MPFIIRLCRSLLSLRRAYAFSDYFMPGLQLKRLCNAVLPVNIMRLLTAIAMLMLTGCVSVYGPTKTGNQPTEGSAAVDPNSPDAANTQLIGNRKPDELLDRVGAVLAAKGITPTLTDRRLGVVGVTGSDTELAALYLDCAVQTTPSNLTQEYRILIQVYSAGEGSHVMVQVSGVAGLTTPDGNDKVKPFECQSSGVLEKDLLEALRK